MASQMVDTPEAERGAETILDALGAAIPAMASRAADIAAAMFPEAGRWDELERRRFEHQAADRLDAILRVTRSDGQAMREVVFDELTGAGADAAAGGAPLPPLLLTLRVSRDLLVQTAVRDAGARGARWAPALAVVLTKVLPASDRLTDAVTHGYWMETMRREAEGSSGDGGSRAG